MDGKRVRNGRSIALAHAANETGHLLIGVRHRFPVEELNRLCNCIER